MNVRDQDSAARFDPSFDLENLAAVLGHGSPKDVSLRENRIRDDTFFHLDLFPRNLLVIPG
jgi:hypothetical protein